MEYIALPYNTKASTLWTSFGGRILGCQREPHSTTPLCDMAQNGAGSKNQFSKWESMNCYQNDYSWKSSVVKVTTENHILSMIWSMNIIQTGKGSTVVKMGTLQWCSRMCAVTTSGYAQKWALTSMFSKGRKSRPYTSTLFRVVAFPTFPFSLYYGEGAHYNSVAFHDANRYAQKWWNHNQTANPPGLNQHACAIDVCCPHKGSGDTIEGALVTHRNRWKWIEWHDIISSEKKMFWCFILLWLWTMVRRLCVPRRFRYYEKSPATRVWAAELCCYRKWWLVSAFNDFCGNFRLTFAKKSGIAKISQIFEFLCFFSRLTIILAKQSVFIFIMEYRFDYEFIFQP